MVSVIDSQEPEYTIYIYRHLISTHTAEFGVLSQWQELLSMWRRRTKKAEDITAARTVVARSIPTSRVLPTSVRCQQYQKVTLHHGTPELLWGEACLPRCSRRCVEEEELGTQNQSQFACNWSNAAVPSRSAQRIIQERTGHRSLAALRTYERTTGEQYEAVSSLLAARSTVSGPTYINQYRQSKDIQIQQPATTSYNYTKMH